MFLFLGLRGDFVKTRELHKRYEVFKKKLKVERKVSKFVILGLLRKYPSFIRLLNRRTCCR